MRIGELFVSIGFEGAPKAIEQLNGVKKGLSSISSEALGALAQVTALVGAFTGLAIVSGNAGQKLVQYSNLTGLGISKLQDWQYALGNAGVGIDETTQALLGLQQAFSQPNLLKNGLPPWLGVLGSLAGPGTDVLKAIQNPDPSAIMEVFRKAAQNAKTPRDRQTVAELLRSQGLSNNIIQALFSSAGATAPQASAAFKRTLEQAQALAKMRVEITRLGQELERKFDSFLLKNFSGIQKVLEDLITMLPQILTAITPVIAAVSSLAKTFLNWALKHPDLIKDISLLTVALYALSIPLGIIGALIGGIAAALSPVAASLVAVGVIAAQVAEVASGPESKMEKFKEIMFGRKDELAPNPASVKEFENSAFGKWIAEHSLHLGSGGGTHNTTINQNITAPDPISAGKAAAKGVHEVVKKKDVNHAYRSNSKLNVHS